jgi:hypothetical protein
MMSKTITKPGRESHKSVILADTHAGNMAYAEAASDDDSGMRGSRHSSSD